MIEELTKRWEQAEVVDEIRKGDVYIIWNRSMFTVAISETYFPVTGWSENVRLLSRRVPRVPDDVLVIMAVVSDDKSFGRRALIRVNDGDDIWYTSEEDGYCLGELEDIRAMVETGEFL